jgi:hypothetical protein
MGLQNTLGFIESGITLDQQIGWHLQANHYPPVPSSMVAVCVDVIRWLSVEDNDPNELFELPEGISWRGESSAPATAIAEGHHLFPFVAHEAGEEW